MLPFLAQTDGSPGAAENAQTLADATFWERVLTYLGDHGPDLALQVLGALAILLVGRFVAGAIRRGIVRLMHKREVDPSLAGFVSSLVYFAILAFTIIAMVGQFGVETASFVAILGAASFAVGMALQGTLANFASGVMLLLFRPFKTGNFIEAAGIKGTVKDIQIFSTTLATPDNVRITVPNGKIYGDIIKNYQGYDTRRVDMVMGIGYGSDVDKAMVILGDLCAKDTRILNEPEVVIAVSELAESSVNIVVRPWVKGTDYWKVFFDMQKNVKREFDAAGIEIPFPQRVVHLNQTAG